MGHHSAGLTQAAQFLERGAQWTKSVAGWRRALAAFAAGAAAALALAPFYVLPLMALGFSTLVLLIDGAESAAKPYRAAFAAGWFFGFGYFLVGVYWMAFSFFVQAEEFAWMAPFVVIGVPAFLALFPAGAALVAGALWRAGWARIFVFAVIFVLFEYGRGHILTGLPWNLPGQALAGSAVSAQTAAWYGAYGLSLVAVIIAAAPAAGLGRSAPPARAMSGLAAMVVAVAALYLAGFTRLTLLPEPAATNEYALRIVQPNIPQRDKIDNDKRTENFFNQVELSVGAAPTSAILFVIWPENGAWYLDEDENALSILSNELPQSAYLVTGSVRRERGETDAPRYFNSLVVAAPTAQGRRVIAAYDKNHLVPFGEYLPFYPVLSAIGLAQLAPYGDAGFAAGPGPRTLRVGGTSFAPLICYEAIFPRALYPKGERPDWLLAVTNDAWFGDTSGPRQHLDQARLRSIETGLPMARAANTGISAVIDAKGRILKRLKLYERGKIDAPLPPPLPPTLYERMGDGLYLILSLAGLGAAWRLGRRTRL